MDNILSNTGHYGTYMDNILAKSKRFKCTFMKIGCWNVWNNVCMDAATPASITGGGGWVGSTSPPDRSGSPRQLLEFVNQFSLNIL